MSFVDWWRLCVDSIGDRTSKTLDKSSIELTNLKSHFNLEDVWRHCYATEMEISYIDSSSRFHNRRIDLWLGSKKIVTDTCTCIMKQAPTPDHKGVAMDITQHVIPEGKVIGRLITQS